MTTTPCYNDQSAGALPLQLLPVRQPILPADQGHTNGFLWSFPPNSGNVIVVVGVEVVIVVVLMTGIPLRLSYED